MQIPTSCSINIRMGCRNLQCNCVVGVQLYPNCASTVEGCIPKCFVLGYE